MGKPRRSPVSARALVGVAATAAVLTAGCTPVVTNKSVSVKKVSTTGHLTYAAVADGSVAAATPARNSGHETTLVSSAIAGQAKTAYLMFKVAGLPAGATVKAHLVLHRTDHHLPSTLQIATAASSWQESSLTAANAPAAGPVIATAKPQPAPTALSIDVSGAVRANGNLTLVIKNPTAGTTAILYSREAGALAPALVVDYSKVTKSIVSSAAKPPVALPVRPPITPVAPVTPPSVPSPPAAGNCAVSATLVSSCGIWWGAAASPLGSETWDQALANFESSQGRLSDVLHYYHVGAALFPTTGELNRANQGGTQRILMENWKPEQGRSWAQVAAGDPVVDAAIDNEADYLKTHFTAKFFLSIHHEPEDEVKPAAGSGFTATDYAAMYRHVVERLRADGVTNAVFVMDYMGSAKWGSQSWFNALYPGDDVVDWIAEDPYSVGTATPWRTDFAGMVNRRDGSAWPGFYTWATTSHPGKPIMLAEWGVTEDPQDGAAKTSFFDSEASIARSFPAIKAILYWNAPTFPALDGATRIDSSAASLASFRELAAQPIFNPPLP